jgi:NDP-sugar pyrophosphorylase family protein
MKEVFVLPPDDYGRSFIPPQYLPPGRDEYWLRNRQSEPRPWRKLRAGEKAALLKNNNYCADWDAFLVCDPFDPALISNSHFYGLVRLGELRNVLLAHHDLRIPAGVRNSTIISCDIGRDAAIQDCACISHYIIGDRVILSRIDEMQTTNHAKFGSGIIKEGETEDVRIWIDVMNEAGGRSILPFAEMIPADAFLWACYRDDAALTEALKAITQKSGESRRGVYGVVGSGSIVKSCRIIKDVTIGEGAYIKGANKLKNLTVLSSEEESSQIGEGVELVNGIVGYGCHIFYGSKAVRFVMGRNANLKYGARLIHSVLGDNSTVSCCEILNNLLFPVHEQHHNNSFLIAAMIQGLSNMAAGATIGSNHNSRANDGEIRAGRGFWPGLAVTLKHSSRFASYVLIAKGDYPYELNITLPFSLVNNNTQKNRLEVMPAYFWMYNLYALERNAWKAVNRDRRKHPVQVIETAYLAPDTAEEIIAALTRMESWMDEAGMQAEDPGSEAPVPPSETEDPEYEYNPAAEEVLAAPSLERHRRGAVIIKPRQARAAYREMLRFYAMKTIIAYLEARPALNFSRLKEKLAPAGAAERVSGWVNLGGQIAPAFRVDALRQAIREGTAATWEAIHGAYRVMHEQYPEDKAAHAWSVLLWLRRGESPPLSGAPPETLDLPSFQGELQRVLEIQRRVTEQVYVSRAKDFQDPFRAITYRNREEMDQVAGRAEENFFIKYSREQLAQFEETCKTVAGQIVRE